MTAARLISEIAAAIHPPSEEWRRQALVRLDLLTKPRGSLGRLEEIAAQISAIRQQDLSAPAIKAVYVFAADHGITAESVSAYPREVTRQMVSNFLGGGAAINVLAQLHNVQLNVIDVGVDADFAETPGLHLHKIARGSRNMLREAAMSESELLLALTVGANLAGKAAAAGHVYIGIGEMGIGNTTAASVITCALTAASPSVATGHGTGINNTQLARKIRIVEAILQRHFDHETPVAALDILRCGGGLEIAAMTGMILAAARHRLLILMDGFISTAAAALAVAMVPAVRGYLFASHRSEEPGHNLLLHHLQIEPILALGLRLGEGTGAVLAMPILESAVCLYTQMATFASAGISGESA